jgi:hypothetical protein
MDNIDIDKVVDFVSECSEYIYDYASTYTGSYTPVDHRKWEDRFLILWQQYKFSLRRIKEGIDNGTIMVNNFNLFDGQPKLKKLYPELYKKHLEGLHKFEKKYKNLI